MSGFMYLFRFHRPVGRREELDTSLRATAESPPQSFGPTSKSQTLSCGSGSFLWAAAESQTLYCGQKRVRGPTESDSILWATAGSSTLFSGHSGEQRVWLFPVGHSRESDSILWTTPESQTLSCGSHQLVGLYLLCHSWDLDSIPWSQQRIRLYPVGHNSESASMLKARPESFWLYPVARTERLTLCCRPQ